MARVTIRFAGTAPHVTYPFLEKEQERLIKEFRLYIAGNQGLGIPVGGSTYDCDADGKPFKVMLNFASIAAIHVDPPDDLR